MINFDDVTYENKTEDNPKWPYIPDHSHRILLIESSGSEKTNASLNLINHQPDIDKIHLCVEDPYEAKYQHLSNKREKVGLNHYGDPKAFIKYSNDIQDIYKNTAENNPGEKCKVLIVLDDMIVDMISNKKVIQWLLNCSLEAKKLIFQLFLLSNHILRYY